jgi:Spy/CpxP family protein refolding chaperone/uncharacterized tellurite resistance protein B-like protein
VWSGDFPGTRPRVARQDAIIAARRLRWIEHVNPRIILVATLVAACGGATAPTHPALEPPPEATAADIDEDAVADLFERDRHHHYGGITMFVAMSIDSLGLMPSQRTAVLPIQRELYRAMDVARDAEKAVTSAVVDGVSNGIDRARINNALARLRVDASSVHTAATDALNRLHAALNPEQRATLADKVEAHWMVWRQANPADELNRPRGQLANVADRLALSPQQLDAVRARFALLMKGVSALDVDHVSSEVQTFEKAFASDTFDAVAIPQTAVSADVAGFGAARLAAFCEALTPLLDEAQRAKLVSLLHEHQTHGENDVDAR